MPRKKKGDNKVEVGNIRQVSGKVTIAAGDIYEGYTAEQVSLLLTQITAKYQRKPFDGRCPYKGLDVFEEEDADLFFGRERLADDLVNRVKESRTVFITGPSGSGKSSLVRAGLIHALKQGAIKNLHSERWLYETMKPGREPLKDLALAFSRLKSPELADYFQSHAHETDVLNKCAESVMSSRKDQRFLLFVDQFEEVFTQINQEDERQAFINMLAHASTVENGRVIVLFAMRSDFVSNCATYPALNELLGQEFRQIGAMQPEELVAAIALPAKQVGLPIEDELIARIINDMKGEPGALPLMQFALKDLFDSQQEKGGVIELTLKDYLRHGGIHKSLERHADKSFAKLSEGEQHLARSIFSGLIEIGRGTVDTRRTALFDELVPANASSADVLVIVQKLADARLIITDEQAGKDTVTISHEKLIEAWPWLKKLVNENRDVIALQNEIASDAKEWEDHQRDQSYLYTGARLANAREQLESKKLVLSGLANEFVQSAIAQQRRKQLTNRVGVAVIGLAMTVAVIVFSVQSSNSAKIAATAQAASTEAIEQKAAAQTASTLAVEQAEKAQRQTTISRSQALVANSQLQKSKSQISLLLALEAFDVVANLPHTERIPAEQAVRDSLSQVSGIPLLGSELVFSPDGRWLATRSDEGSAHLQDMRNLTAEPTILRLQEEWIDELAFSPDGRWLATASSSGIARLWDMNNLAAESILLGRHESRYGSSIDTLTFSSDGRWLAAATSNDAALLWDLKDLTAEPIILYSQEVWIDSLTFSPDGRWLATWSYLQGTARLWDLGDPTAEPIVLRRGDGYEIHTFVFSSDGRWLAIVSGATAGLWDLKDPVAEPLVLGKYEINARTFGFSPDGRWLAIGGDYGTVFLGDAKDPTAEPIILSGHEDLINALAFSPDGGWLATASSDATARLWNLEDPAAEPIILRGHEGKVNALAFSPDGHGLATGSDDGIVRLWDVNDPKADPIILRGYEKGIMTLTFSPDGRWLATASYGTARLWNVMDPMVEPNVLSGHKSSVVTLAFSPDAHWLATSSDDATALLDLKNPMAEPITMRGQEEWNLLVFSPDGRWLATASPDGPARLWNMKDPTAKLMVLGGHEVGHRIYRLAFSPDGRWLVAATGGAIAHLWNVKDLTAEPVILRGQEEWYRLAFSPDGRWLATKSNEGKVNLRDLRNLAAGPTILSLQSEWIDEFAFSPDGHWLATVNHDSTDLGNNGTARLWDLKDLSAEPIVLRGEGYEIATLAFSPDGRWLATGVDMWDLKNPTTEPILLREYSGLTFSPYGRWLAATNFDTALLWDMKHPADEPIVLRGHESQIVTLAFSLDERWLATGSDDTTARLWDMKDPSAEPIVLRGDNIDSLTFSPDGHWLVTVSRSGLPRLWNLDIGQVITTACNLVGRNFTPAEWAQYFPNEEYRKTCEQWPLEEPILETVPTPEPTRVP